jgi:ribosomal protein L44E
MIICTTRYNNQTWEEYQQWKQANQETYEQTYKRPLKCIYGTPREISSRKIKPNIKICIIEMHNDLNKIMGIGIIENRTANEVYRSTPAHNISHTAPVLPLPQQPIKYKIFTERNYNRYIYIGNEFYLSREEIERHTHTQDAQPQDAHPQDAHPQGPPLLETIIGLEAKLFKGSRHCKRGSGITKIPNWIIEEGHTKSIEMQIHCTTTKKSS